MSSKRRSLSAEVGRLRSVKSEAEQRIMKEAARVSGRAHAKVRIGGVSFITHGVFLT